MSDEVLRELVRELEVAFEAVGRDVPAPEGRVRLGEVALRPLMDRQLDAETSASMSVSELLMAIADGEPRVLVHNAIRNPGPPDWDWSLDSFRIGDRGYIALILEEEGEEPFQPVYGSWEPYESQAALEASFVAVYEAHLDPILFGTHLWLGERVSRELLTRALWAGLEAADSFRWEQLRDYALPLDTPTGRRAVLDYWLANAPEP
ncbi:MAG TPA: hypothetical protein VFV93_08005 [Thermomicrobiales bacterium]|nr:hypothetical protein [Thermomicrobiales bacterium]